MIFRLLTVPGLIALDRQIEKLRTLRGDSFREGSGMGTRDAAISLPPPSAAPPTP